MPISFRETMNAAPIARLQWAVASMLTCVIILDGLDLQLASYSAPLLMRQWHLTKPGLSPLLAAAMIGMAVGALTGSWLSDRYGRRPTLIASVLSFGVMTLVCAGASGPRTFMLWRFLSGCGFGAAFPVATALMSEWMPRRATGKAISIMTLGFPIGAIGGAMAASWLLPHVGWRGCFATASIVCLVFTAALLWKLPESPSYLILHGRQRETHALLARAWRGPIGDSREAFYLEQKQEGGERLLTRGNARVNTGLWLAVLGNSLATYAIAGWLTVILVGLNLPLTTALRGPMVFSFSAIFGTLATGWLLVRLGSRPVMVFLSTCSLIIAIGLSMVAFAIHPGSGLLPAIFIGLSLQGLCTGGLQASLYVLAANAYETNVRSRGIGAASLVGRVGTILSSFAGAAALAIAHAGGFFALTAALTTVVIAGLLIVDRHIPRFDAVPATQRRGFALVEKQT